MQIRTATQEGTAGPCADAAAVYQAADGTAGAAVIDGIGHDPGTVSLTPVLAEVAARIAARRSPLAGLLTAAELVADPGDGAETEPDAVAVVATAHPEDEVTRVAWVGDCRAWGWTGTELRQYTTDQTMGAWLRLHGDVPAEIAEHHDAWVRVSLSTVVVATAREVEIPDPVVILTTDGVHDAVPHGDLAALVREHQADGQALADALVAAARAGAGGSRDDATVVVLRREG